MSPLKFRAWDPKTKTMIPDTGLPHTDYRGSVDLTNHVWMQSTGLHDKNRKEIFEGDLIRMSPQWMFEMKWGPELAKFYLRSRLAFRPQTRKGTFQKFVATAAQKAAKGEVIGNVYESPSLLPA